MAKKNSHNQIFFDASGKRRHFVNFSVILLGIVFIVIAVFIGIYSYRLSQINNLANNPSYKETNPETNTALLYTSSNSRAFSIARDQIEKIDTIILPKYLLRSNEISTPTVYQDQVEDIQSMSENKPVHYATYYLLSAYDYNILPTERASTLPNDIKVSDLPNLITLKQMLSIREDLIKNNVSGLYIELPSNGAMSNDQSNSLKDWLENFQTVLNERNLHLGIRFNPNSLNSRQTEIYSQTEYNFVAFDSQKPIQPQIELLKAQPEIYKKTQIFEIPTVSNGIDRVAYNDYVKSVSYAEIEAEIVDKPLENRGFEAVAYAGQNTDFNMFDAISANNILIYLKAQNLIHNNTQFAISDPGYEEFTVWRLLHTPYEYIRNHYLLSENVTASLDIQKVGYGEVSALQKEGKVGKRKIIAEDKTFITSSTVLKNQEPTIVTKTGLLPQKIALTFDDGPHQTYTPKILDILDKYNVKGTFFVVGTNVIAHPDTAREIVARGHEIENHSYNHPVFSKLTTESQTNQIRATSELIQAVTGEPASFFRKPFSDNNDIQTEQDVAYLDNLKGLGLESSEYDIDSKDWLLDTPDQIVDRVISELNQSNGEYSQILFHDTHSEIEKTFIALPKVIEYLQKNNIEIVRVDELVQTSKATHASTTKEYRALDLKNKIFVVFVWINVFLLAVALLKYTWMIIGGIAYYLKHRLRTLFLKRINNDQRNLPSLGIIIACYNEELVIGRTIQGLLDGHYKKFKVTVINDGSKDKTANVVEEYCKKDKRVKLINLPNGGKAKALEKGIALARSEWLVFCDADTIFHKDALKNFADSVFTNKKVGAVAGRIYVGNTVNSLTRSQAIEYGVAHLFTKAAQDIINSITVVPGALGLWNRKQLVKNGGFTSDTLAEDADATMRMISSGKRVKYYSSITAKTEAPEKMRMLYKQRTRWQLGNMQATIKHRRGIFNRRYGALGFFGLPLMMHELITTMLFPLLFAFSIFVILARVYNWEIIIPQNLEFITSNWFILLSLSLVMIEVVLSAIVIIFEKTSFKNKLLLLATLPYYITIYKTFLSYSTLVAMFRAAKGTLQGWGHLARTASVK